VFRSGHFHASARERCVCICRPGYRVPPGPLFRLSPPIFFSRCSPRWPLERHSSVLVVLFSCRLVGFSAKLVALFCRICCYVPPLTSFPHLPLKAARSVGESPGLPLGRPRRRGPFLHRVTLPFRHLFPPSPQSATFTFFRSRRLLAGPGLSELLLFFPSLLFSQHSLEVSSALPSRNVSLLKEYVASCGVEVFFSCFLG